MNMNRVRGYSAEEMLPRKYVLTRIVLSLTKGRMPLVYVFAASKMEAQPVLVLAARDGASSDGSGALIIQQGGGRFAVIITGMGTRNAEAKADAALGRAAPGAGGGPPLPGKPDAVLVIGLCGGLTESLRVRLRQVCVNQCRQGLKPPDRWER